MSKEVPQILENWFFGNWEIFCEAINNPETIFVYDIDGILIDSPAKIFGNFTKRTGIYADPTEIDRLDYLTHLARISGLDEEIVKHAEDEWYMPEPLRAAHRYLYIKPVVERTLRLYGPGKNYILTSRNPGLKEITLESIGKNFPGILPENILITEDDEVDRAVFKAKNLKKLAKIAPWVIFVDDSVDFAKAALGNGTKNCIVVNIPTGKTVPGFEHERLVYIKRFPARLQAMWPFMRSVQIASEGY